MSGFPRNHCPHSAGLHSSAEWHRILDAAGVRQARLHDARHTAATLLMVQGVPAGVAMRLLGHSDTRVTARYQHEAAVEPELRALQGRMSVDEVTTERILEGVARIGQHRFAVGVLANCSGSCVFCGFKPAGLEGHRLLVASHIKQWRDSTNPERLDVANGLAACPTHDAAFDTGLLYVNGGLRVHRSPKLARSETGGAHTLLYLGKPPINERLALADTAIQPGTHYLQWHREKISVACVDRKPDCPQAVGDKTLRNDPLVDRPHDHKHCPLMVSFTHDELVHHLRDQEGVLEIGPR